MNLFIFAVLFLWLFRTSQQFFGLLKTVNFLKNRNRTINSDYNKNLKLNILIPVFNEEEIITQTVEYFSYILDEINKSFEAELFFVSTNREAEFSKNKTVKVIQNSLKNLNINSKIDILHFDLDKNSNKAIQLNFAIKNINKNYNLNKYKNNYFAIFDADSRPELGAFLYFNNQVNINLNYIYQMPTLFIQNIKNISFNNQANAIFQTRRVLAFEISSWLNKKSLNYLVGHGLFINSKVFTEKNLYFDEKTITEDLIFGYETNLQKIYPEIIPYFDFSTVPKSIFINIKQTARWFSGDLFFFKSLKFHKKFNKLVLFRYFHIFEWLFGSILLNFIFLFLIINLNLCFLLLFFGTLFFYIFILHFFALRIIQKIKTDLKIKYINLIFGLFIKAMTNSFGPIYGVFREFLSLVKLKKYEFEKTER
jgi:hypothetical protein